MELQVGQRVNDYEILSVLGAGGMGRVYSVSNIISGRTEAMKVLLPDLSAERDLADRFISEIRTLASFDHPNIAQLRTAFQFENQLVMVMEYVEGVTLEQLAKKGPMPVEAVVDYISQTLSALSYAHGRGVVHRDIKPANMMITSHGVVKLMDFGIAKSSNEPQLTRPGTTIGSMYYMSPEQVRGDTIDARSDIYSVGITLYELLAGRKPFMAESTFSILNQQLNEVPKPIVEVNPTVPRRLSDVVMLALAKDSFQRFQTADAFRNALRPFLAPQETGTTWAPVSRAAVTGPEPVAESSPMARPPEPSYVPVPLAAAPVSAAKGSAPRSAPESMDKRSAGPGSASPGSAGPQLVGGETRSRRGLWIGLGAAAALVAIILAATVLPRVLTTHAANEPRGGAAAGGAAQPAGNASPGSAGNSGTSSAQATESPSAASQSPAGGTPTPPQTTSGPQTYGAPNAGAPSPGNQNSGNQNSGTPSSGAGKPHSVQTPGVRGGTGTQPDHSAPGSPANSAQGNRSEGASPDGASQPAAEAQVGGNSQRELEEVSESLTQFQARASAASESIDRLRRQQEQEGLGLRGDMAAALNRMNAYEASANRSIAERNAGAASKSLERAQRELDTLEKFLGK